MVEHELDFYRENKEAVAHLLAEPFQGLQLGGILFGSDDDLRRRQPGKRLVDASDVLLLEVVVVGEEHGECLLAERLHVDFQLFGRCDAGEQHGVLVFQCTGVHAFVAEELLHPAVFERREVEILIGIEVHCLGEHAVVDGFHVLRTLRDDDDVGAVLARERFAQPACRQHLVVDDEAVVVDEQDVDARFDVSVLEGIVEEDDIRVLCLVVAGQFVDAVTAVLVYGDVYVRVLLLHLIRFVTDVAHRRVAVSQDVAAALPLVAAAEHCHLHLVCQEAHQVFHMRCLSGTAHGDVSDGDDGNVETAAFQHSEVEKLVPEADAHSVEPADGQQPLPYFDEVSFHDLSLSYIYIIRYTCLDGVLLLHVLHEHERLVVFAERQLQLLVEIAAG